MLRWEGSRSSKVVVQLESPLVVSYLTLIVPKPNVIRCTVFEIFDAKIP